MYKIEKNIPLLPKQEKYPLSKMEIGDSIFVEGDKKRLNALTANVSSYKKRNAGKKFTCRTVENGVRVWRTA